jgi:flavin reductase (DIM6/NTAB) family NADH-FMN oxidoreductase RutF
MLVVNFMKHFSLDEIASWDRFYRANFINSLSGFKPVSLIATKNTAGIANLAIFSNIVHIGADPALVGFINRPKDAAPHTIENIEQTGSYTINHIHPSFVSAAHQTSAKYDLGISEFEKVGLHAEYKADFPAPFLMESHVQYALELSEIIPIKRNNTYLVIGEIKHVFIDPNVIENDGLINLSKVESMVSLGIDAYCSTSPVARFQYAKPDKDSAMIRFE